MNNQRKRQSLVGKVVSSKMDKTVNVRVTREIPHPVYRKRVKRYKNYLAHISSVHAEVGDLVMIRSIRPISKLKRWQVSKIIKKVRVLQEN